MSSATSTPEGASPPPTSATQLTSARTVARGSIWALAAALIPPIYTFVTSITAARFLGAAGLGRVAFIAYVNTTLATILVFGLPMSLMRHVAETMGSGHAGRVRSLIRSVVPPLTVTAVLAFVTLTSIGLLGGSPRLAWMFAGIACAGAVMHTIPSNLLVGVQRWRSAYVVGITSGAVAMVVKIVILSQGAGVTDLFAVDAAIVTVNVMGTSYLALRAARQILPPAEPAGDLTRRVWKFASIATIGILINLVVYRRTEVFFLERFSSDVQVAIYSVPFSLVEVVILLPRMLGQVIGPAVATLYGAGEKERIASGYGRAVRIVLPLAMFVTAGAVVVGPTLIELLYGSQFKAAGNVLVILLSTLPFMPLMALSASVLFGLGKQWIPTAIGGFAAVVNIALDFLLIPRFNAIGAAIANSSAQIVGSIPLAVYAVLCVGSISFAVGALLRAIVAAAFAGGLAALPIVLLPPVEALPVAIVVFLVVAVPAMLNLRILAPADAAWLATIAPRRLARPLAHAARLGATFGSATAKAAAEPSSSPPADPGSD